MAEAAGGGMTVDGGAAVAGAMTGAKMCIHIVIAEQQVAERRTGAADTRVAVVGVAAAGAGGESRNRSRKKQT